MKNTKKILLCCLCVLLIVAGTVLATLAYLTDQSSVKNTFTVGKVDIKVDESDVDEKGEIETDPSTGETLPRVEENDYHLLPGETYVKDPTMTVQKGSEDSYVRMILTIHNNDAVKAIIDNPIHGLTDYADLLGGWDQETWNYIGFTEDTVNNTISFEFRYKEIVPASDEDQVLEPLFTSLIVPATLSGDELASLYGSSDTPGDFAMTIEGHAIQATGFADNAETGATAEDAAWAAFDVQMELEEQNNG